jgi:hypothetical protein
MSVCRLETSGVVQRSQAKFAKELTEKCCFLSAVSHSEIEPVRTLLTEVGRGSLSSAVTLFTRVSGLPSKETPAMQ